MGKGGREGEGGGGGGGGRRGKFFKGWRRGAFIFTVPSPDNVITEVPR